MQAVAAENNLSETAFFAPETDGLRIRWFTPTDEVDLCGHATLAAAHVLCNVLQPGLQRVEFQSMSGPLAVNRVVDQGGQWLELDFPAWPPEPCEPPEGLLRGLAGPRPFEVLQSRDYLVVYQSQAQVLALAPDMRQLKTLDKLGVIATAPGGPGGPDFVSRFFAPAVGIDEDPVTGSAHTTLVPYWAERLGKKTLCARQISRRGGELRCRLQDGRALIAGQAALYLKGCIVLGL